MFIRKLNAGIFQDTLLSLHMRTLMEQVLVSVLYCIAYLIIGVNIFTISEATVQKEIRDQWEQDKPWKSRR